MQQSTKNMRFLAVFVVIFIGIVFFKQAEAKRGCSSFGHSCFGGHGKRADAVDNLNAGLRGIGQDEIAAPRPIYPQSSTDVFGNGDDVIPIRGGGFMDNNDEGNMEQMKNHLSPFLRHWLIAYRRAQESNNGYPYNNLI